MIGIESKVRINDGLLVNQIVDETVVLNPATGRYYCLNDVATRMWSVLAGATSVAAALESLAAEYDTPRERLRADLLALIDELASYELVTISTS